MVAYPAKILVADHDAKIRSLLRSGLMQHGYRLIQAGSGGETIRLFRKEEPDALILELDLPDQTGFAVIRAIRAKAPTPIIVLSARGSVDTKVKALELGAADYITKPFDMEELLARLKAALRHGLQVTGEAPVFRSGALAVDLVDRHVSLAGAPVHLTRMEYKVLRCLVGNAGRAVTHQHLCREIGAASQNLPYLRELISQLRHKIDPDARLLATEVGVGYRLLKVQARNEAVFAAFKTGHSAKDAPMNMHAMRIHTFGGPDVLTDDLVPLPEAKSDEILVRIAAASVNPVDGKIREGKFAKVNDEALPVTLGRDLSGVVESIGPNAQKIRKGDAVFALLGYDRGAYAQYVLLKPEEWAIKPEMLSHVEAAAVPLAALTAWQGLIDQGGLRKGQRVLVHGGAGGVGHFAIQIAKAQGAWVAATCSGDDQDFVRGLGADQAIDYKNEKFETRVSDIDLVYDLIGGETQERSFTVLKQGGALISTLQEPDKAKALARNIKIAHYMAQPDAGELARIAGLIDAGKIKPVICKTFDLAQAAQAQIALGKEHVRGKIVLTVQP